jgi:hypothetical protein
MIGTRLGWRSNQLDKSLASLQGSSRTLRALSGHQANHHFRKQNRIKDLPPQLDRGPPTPSSSRPAEGRGNQLKSVAVSSCDSTAFFPSAEQYAGRWIAWKRDQTTIVGTGRTFEEAKQAATAAGESAVLLARVPALQHRIRLGRPLLYIVAVFISQVT